MMKKFLDSEGLSYLWEKIKEYVSGVFTASNIVNTIGSTAVRKATDADTVDGKHASAFSLTSHNHDTRYALINHTHDDMGSGTGFGTLDLDSGEILLAEYDYNTYTCYRLRDNLHLMLNADGAYERGSDKFHKIMFFNQSTNDYNVVIETSVTRLSGRVEPLEIVVGSGETAELTIVYSQESILTTYVCGREL